MAIGWVNYKYFFVIFTFCIGHGDGRWKRKDKEDLYQDIEVFKKMAEKIEYEIEAFYEDYPDEQIKRDDIEKIQQEYIKKFHHHKTETKNSPDRKETSHFRFTANITNEIPPSLKLDSSQSTSNHVSFLNNDLSISNSDWPKFEDILLEMGKKYDWKNDRWIKVKRKFGGKTAPLKKIYQESNISLHEKHKFSYRTVKLNRKSRRNVVIAVTAVR